MGTEDQIFLLALKSNGMCTPHSQCSRSWTACGRIPHYVQERESTVNLTYCITSLIAYKIRLPPSFSAKNNQIWRVHATSLIAYRNLLTKFSQSAWHRFSLVHFKGTGTVMWNVYDVCTVSKLLISYNRLGQSKPCGHFFVSQFRGVLEGVESALAEVFWPIFGHSEASCKWCNRACAMIAMERREEYHFHTPMFASLPYSPHSARRPTVLPLFPILSAHNLSFPTVAKAPYSSLRHLPPSSLSFLRVELDAKFHL